MGIKTLIRELLGPPQDPDRCVGAQTQQNSARGTLLQLIFIPLAKSSPVDSHPVSFELKVQAIKSQMIFIRGLGLGSNRPGEYTHQSLATTRIIAPKRGREQFPRFRL